ncbi:MAG: ATP-binding protein [Terriglobales bacterium]
MRSDATFIGTVRRVVGATVYAVLLPDLPSAGPIVNGRIYRIGQIGSFVRIPIGFLNTYGIVSMVGAVAIQGNETLGPVSSGAERTLEIKLVGEAFHGSRFERGLSTFPTIDDEIHVVTDDDLETVYAPHGASPVCIGTHAASAGLPATLGLDKLVTRHAAILGSTGSGKSNTVAAILKAITCGPFPKARIIVIDPHGEYESAFGGISKVFKIGDETSPFYLPYWCLSFDELGWFLVGRKSASESLQDGNLRDKILQMRKASAATVRVGARQNPLAGDEVTVDSPLPFDIRELWYYFDRLERVTFNDMPRTAEALVREGDARRLLSAEFTPPGPGMTSPYKPTQPQVMAGYTHKILQRLRDHRFGFLLEPGPYDGIGKDLDSLVGDWLNHDRPITVFDLAGVPAEIIDMVVGLVSRTLFEVMFWGRMLADVGRQRPTLLVFEEAHRYVPSGEGTFIQGYARRALQKILKEGRKYGLGAVLVSQRPSELDETVLSQCGTFIALRMSNSQDQARVQSVMPDELVGLAALLPALRTGEAIVSGEATQIPSRVRVTLIEPRPSSGDPKVSELWGGQAECEPDYRTAVTNWRRQRVEGE